MSRSWTSTWTLTVAMSWRTRMPTAWVEVPACWELTAAPGERLRAEMYPENGARKRALSRPVWAILRNARAPSTLDRARATWLRWVSTWLTAAARLASAVASDAWEDSAFVLALSRSIAAISPRPWRSSSRAAFRVSLSATLFALTRFASWLTTLAFADSRVDSATFRLASAVATAPRRLM